MPNLKQQPNRLTRRTIKARQVAKAVVEGQSYTEIARQFYPNAKHPRQHINMTLKNKSVQAELAKISIEDKITPAYLLTILDNLLTDDKAAIRAKALELGMKYKAMLTEKVETKDTTEVSADELKLAAERAITSLVASSRMTQDGLNASKASVELVPVQVEPITQPSEEHDTKTE